MQKTAFPDWKLDESGNLLVTESAIIRIDRFTKVGNGRAAESTDKPRTLIEATYLRLRKDILEAEYQPGQKLRVEHLKEKYQASSGTLREALVQLLSDCLVVSEGQRGFRVAPMSIGDLEDLTRVRVLLECEAVRESMTLGTDEWEKSVVGSFHLLSRAEERLQKDPEGAFADWERCNSQFHESLVSACKSRWLLQFRQLLYRQSERYRRVAAVNGPPPGKVHDEHRAIFEAAMARNTELAAAELTGHIHRSLSVIRKTALLK